MFYLFFLQFIPSGALINRLKHFHIHKHIHIRGDIWHFFLLCGVNYSAESDSTVSITPRSLTPQCQLLRGVRLWYTVSITPGSKTLRCQCHPEVSIEISSFYFLLNYIIHFDLTAVSLMMRSQIAPCHWHCGVRLRSVKDTAQSDSALSMTQRSQLGFNWWPLADFKVTVK